VNLRSVTMRRSKTMCCFKHMFIIKTVKYLASVMVRECFSGMQGGLCFLSKNCTMNGKRYKMVLEYRLNSLMRVH
jgi:hypothetical protein